MAGDFEEQGAGELETLVTELEARVRASAEDAAKAAKVAEEAKRDAAERIARAEGALEEQRTQLKELKEAHIAQHRAGVNGMGGKGKPKSLGEQFVESEAFRVAVRDGRRDTGRVKVQVGERSLMTTSGVYVDPQMVMPESETPKRRPVVADAIPIEALESQGGVEYVRETNDWILHTISTAQANSGQKVIAVESVAGFSSGMVVTIIPVSGSNITETLTAVTQTADSSPAGTVTVTNNLAANLAAGAQITAATAAPTAEGKYKPGSKFAEELRTASRYTIAAGFTVTRRVFEGDAGRLAAKINRKLPRNIDLIEEDQILNGSGTAPEVTGILADTGVQDFAWSDGVVGDNRSDALARGANLIRDANYEPTGIWMHHDDILELQLTKDAEGRYLFAMPDQNGGVVNLPVTLCKALPSGKAVIGDFEMACTLYRAGAVEIRVFEQHKDYAEKNLVYVRGERDISFAIEHPLALCVVDFDAEPS